MSAMPFSHNSLNYGNSKGQNTENEDEDARPLNLLWGQFDLHTVLRMVNATHYHPLN